jgi:hypothetical protein
MYQLRIESKSCESNDYSNYCEYLHAVCTCAYEGSEITIALFSTATLPRWLSAPHSSRRQRAKATSRVNSESIGSAAA